jgi:hypothetical protein
MSDATDLKQRFAMVRLHTSKSKQLDELVGLGKWRDAQALGEQIGLPVTRGVIDLQARRARQ